MMRCKGCWIMLLALFMCEPLLRADYAADRAQGQRNDVSREARAEQRRKQAQRQRARDEQRGAAGYKRQRMDDEGDDDPYLHKRRYPPPQNRSYGHGDRDPQPPRYRQDYRQEGDRGYASRPTNHAPAPQGSQQSSHDVGVKEALIAALALEILAKSSNENSTAETPASSTETPPAESAGE